MTKIIRYDIPNQPWVVDEKNGTEGPRITPPPIFKLPIKRYSKILSIQYIEEDERACMWVIENTSHTHTDEERIFYAFQTDEPMPDDVILYAADYIGSFIIRGILEIHIFEKGKIT
jgi:hypothetical protein